MMAAAHGDFGDCWAGRGGHGAGRPPSSESRAEEDNQKDTRTVPRGRPLKKAKSHRKRLVPVGPAGIWFQGQEDPGRKRDNDNEEDIEKQSDAPFEFADRSNPQPSDSAATASFTSPAWAAAQYELELSTPSLEPYWSQEKKYHLIKSCLPSNYLLLAEVLKGSADWAFDDHQRLLVQVSTIQSVTANDRLWTAVLEDETGTKLTAWIEPELVRREQQTNKWVRIGNVWLLQGCTIHLVPMTEGWDRILLVGESNICQMWSPASTDNLSTAKYIEWMEARSKISSTGKDTSYIMTEDHPTSAEDFEREDQSDDDGGEVSATGAAAQDVRLSLQHTFRNEMAQPPQQEQMDDSDISEASPADEHEKNAVPLPPAIPSDGESPSTAVTHVPTQQKQKCPQESQEVEPIVLDPALLPAQSTQSQGCPQESYDVEPTAPDHPILLPGQRTHTQDDRKRNTIEDNDGEARQRAVITPLSAQENRVPSKEDKRRAESSHPDLGVPEESSACCTEKPPRLPRTENRTCETSSPSATEISCQRSKGTVSRKRKVTSLLFSEEAAQHLTEPETQPPVTAKLKAGPASSTPCVDSDDDESEAPIDGPDDESEAPIDEPSRLFDPAAYVGLDLDLDD